MAYEPKTWECGETITADDLNRIEEGVADANDSENSNFYIVAFSDASDPTIITSDKTVEEILSAMNDGKIPIGKQSVVLGGSPLIHSYSLINYATGQYTVTFNGTVFAGQSGNAWARVSQ